MLCSTARLVKPGIGYEDTLLLPCRSWDCDICQPQRLRQLKALAASGEPTAMLTLTIRHSVGDGPQDRYKMLHNAWKLLTKRILRQFALPPEKRWLLQSEDGGQYQTIASYRITKSVKQGEYTRLHYMAFVEAMPNSGEPHLHILIRAPFIPQDWISQQMRQLINSPIVDIRKIGSKRTAVAYVTKYVTKKPAQFGRSRRYWYSKHWELNRPEKEKPVMDMHDVKCVREPFRDLASRIASNQIFAEPLETGWIRLWPAEKRYEPTQNPNDLSQLERWRRIDECRASARQATGIPLETPLP